MKTLIISDTHLTHRFDQAKFDKLKSLIEKSDKVIINGDFWDSYLCTFDAFMTSHWQDLFPLLKDKDAVYIFGNHDLKEHSDGRIYEFCTKAVESLNFESGNYSFHVEHGHNIAPNLDMTYSSIFQNNWIQIGSHIVERFLVLMFRSKYFKIFRGMNKVMKHWAEVNLDKEILICGHSHLPFFNLEKKFINLGLIRYGYAQCIYIDEGEVEIIKEKY